MRPRIVGYGSCGRSPPNSISSCYEAFDHGAESFAVDACETDDGVVVAANRRTLRLLGGRSKVVPAWEAIRHADLGAAFGGGATRHRVLELEEFVQATGPLPMRIRVDGPMSKQALSHVEDIVRTRPQGATTVMARPEWLYKADLPAHVPTVAVLDGGEDLDDLASVGAQALALPARLLPNFARMRLPKVALECDTRTAVAAVKAGGAVAVHTERPAWFRAAWMDDPFART